MQLLKTKLEELYPTTRDLAAVYGKDPDVDLMGPRELHLLGVGEKEIERLLFLEWLPFNTSESLHHLSYILSEDCISTIRTAEFKDGKLSSAVKFVGGHSCSLLTIEYLPGRGKKIYIRPNDSSNKYQVLFFDANNLLPTKYEIWSVYRNKVPRYLDYSKISTIKKLSGLDVGHYFSQRIDSALEHSPSSVSCMTSTSCSTFKRVIVHGPNAPFEVWKVIQVIKQQELQRPTFAKYIPETRLSFKDSRYSDESTVITEEIVNGAVQVTEHGGCRSKPLGKYTLNKSKESLNSDYTPITKVTFFKDAV